MNDNQNTNQYRKIVPAKLEDENELQYELFVAYCLLGLLGNRSMAKLVPMLLVTSDVPSSEVEKSVTRLKSWAGKFHWSDRAKSFDYQRVLCHTEKIIQSLKRENNAV